MTQEHPAHRRWSKRQRDLAVVFWIAFLSASVGFVVLFALVNPLDLVAAWSNQFDIGTRLAYGLGFTFIYLVCLLASWLTVFMIRTGPRSGHSNGEGTQQVPEMQDPARLNPDLEDEDWQ